jgi:hypothetical protein
MLAKPCNSCAAKSHAVTAAINGFGRKKSKKRRRLSGVDSSQAMLLAAGIGGGVASIVLDTYALSKVSFIAESNMLRTLAPVALGAAMALGYVGKSPLIKAAGVGMAATAGAKYISGFLDAGVAGIGNDYSYPGASEFSYS